MPQELTLRRKIGQMIMMGFLAKEATPELKQFLSDYQIGNIILFTRNVESKTQLHKLCSDLQEEITRNTGYPAFISVDQEGGMVARLPPDAVSIPAAMAIAATGNPHNAYEAGKITGEELSALGINMNLAPDMDINSNPDNPVIGVRSFGDTKETVTEFGLELINGLRDGGVLPVVKHFPGHGDTAVDSHLGLPVVEKTLSQLKENELVPFQAAIQNGVPGIMSSHILFPNIEAEKLPGTMSHTILTDVLRRQLGFDGLILTDCLEMDAVKKYYGTAQGALAAALAGADLLCVSHTADLVREVVELLEQAVESGELPEQIIDESVERILRYKARYLAGAVPAPLSCVGCDDHRAAAREISEQSITLVHQTETPLNLGGKKTLFVGCYANRTTLAASSVNTDFNFSDYMAGRLNGDALITPLNPTEEEIEAIAQKVKAYDIVVFGSYNGKRFPGQIALANRMSRVNPHMIAVSLFNPYDLAEMDDSITKLAAYEYTLLSFRTLVRIFRGECGPQGRLSVRI